MKSDSNTEMELLLSRHARRRRSTPVAEAGAHEGDQTTGSGGAHMDADEMNAYAENALPAPARERYMAHLADCDHCRAIVTNLTLAANVPLKDPEAEALSGQTSPKRSWREWLAALLSPPVIRYGVPALVLISVVGVVFLALRQRDAEQRRSDEPALVARNNNQSATQNTSIVKAPAEEQTPATLASPTLRGGGPTPAQSTEGEAAQTAAPPADKESLAKTRTNEQAPAGGPEPKDAPAAVAGNEPSRQERAAARDQRDEDLAAAAPKPAAAPPPISTTQPNASTRTPEATESDRLGRNRRDDSTSDDRSGAFGTAGNTTAREAEERQKTTAAKSAPASEARARPARRAGALSDGADSSVAGAGGRSGATRAVGGRQFRQQGNAWVDTAYTQGRATVNITRGSEQYRALIADEPGLRAIADQLGGEVIVVWKGRAYRIR
jgi:hypothetical protein